MSSNEILLSYIKKLGHPLKEIRERALKLLIAKLELGWEFEDELAGTRQLFESLLAWFYFDQPSHQKEALNLLLSVVKTNAGAYIAREYGLKEFYSKCNIIQNKIDADAFELFEDLKNTLCFWNTVQSLDSVSVPPLDISSVTRSESDVCSNRAHDSLGSNFLSPKDSFKSNDVIEMDRLSLSKSQESIKILLFPWAEISPSDAKIIILIEDALKLMKSTRRCCRFIRDVFLRDFPAEIFLNRPSIVQSLMNIIEKGNAGKLSEPLSVLLCIVKALRSRLRQFYSLDMIHEVEKVQNTQHMIDVGLNTELEQIVSDSKLSGSCRMKDDGLEALRQLPAPLFTLDALHLILVAMGRSVIESSDDNGGLDVNELNICVSLTECLIELLLDCVSDSFWCMDHTTKTYRDIAHKSTVVMRTLGDLLSKYSSSFSETTERREQRVSWLRLVRCGEVLLRWCSDCALSPAALVNALQVALLDPALRMFYPLLAEPLADTVQAARLFTNKEYKSKYVQLNKLLVAMEDAAAFMKNTNCICNSKEVLNTIQNSLPVLELHLSDSYLTEVGNILLKKVAAWDLSDAEWSKARGIALSLMAHNSEWVRSRIYSMMVDVLKNVFVEYSGDQAENEKFLIFFCDVGILTEICCHGLSSSTKTQEIETKATEIMLYLLRGRLLLSEACWWRLLASLLPAFPLLHAYAAHDSMLGQAICKSLESDIAGCMGVSSADVVTGLVRLMFVRCPPVKSDAAYSLCRYLDDERYLPPKDMLRSDVLTTALEGVKRCNFNVDYSTASLKTTQTSGLIQVLDVLKQDLTLDAEGHGLVDLTPKKDPTLEPSLRRATLQQLSVVMMQQEIHDIFVQFDGIKIIIATLRMSLLVDDYLAFPECAISCVSVLNSICFGSRHTLSKIADLPALLIRVILIFPANESLVQLAAQILALTAWAGFALQELDESRSRVLALPASVVDRTDLPFPLNSYWKHSPNAVHSSIEWLQDEEDWRRAIRVHWSFLWGGVSTLRDVTAPTTSCSGSEPAPPPPPGPLALRLTNHDVISLQASCPLIASKRALLALQNATSHAHVNEALAILTSFTHQVPLSSVDVSEYASLPWGSTLSRFLCAPPASPRDITLLTSLLKFVIEYLDNVPAESGSMGWIKSSFIDNESSMIGLLSREQLYPQQSLQDDIEVTQLQIHIVKVLLRIILLMDYEKQFDSTKSESLLKILLACLGKIDLKNFHKLGYLNELLRCIRYTVNSPSCSLSEDTTLQCVQLVTKALSGCAAGGGRKGEGCRLDALLTLLAVQRSLHDAQIPVQRWSWLWEGTSTRAVADCSKSPRAELRAAALGVMAALAHHAVLMPHLTDAVSPESLSRYAAGIFAETSEANIVRARAAALLTALSARVSTHSNIYEHDIIQQFTENGFLQNCLEILVEFCNDEHGDLKYLEPNVALSIIERRSELEVRASKCSDVQVSPSHPRMKPSPPTAALIVAIADVLYNVSGFEKCPVQAWNDQTLFRLLFRCTFWSHSSASDVKAVRAAACRALARVADAYKCVCVSLANTKDCLHNLLATLTSLNDEDCSEPYLTAVTQGLLLMATLLSTRAASDTVWREIREKNITDFFYLLLQCLQLEGHEIQSAAMYCITQLMQSTSKKKHVDNKIDDSCVQLFDNLKSPYFEGATSNSSQKSYGNDFAESDCQPEYLSEELCKNLIFMYQKFSINKKAYQATADGDWAQVCSCLSSLLSRSSRTREYAVHRDFTKILLFTLQGIRDHLSMQGKTAETIRNADSNPDLLSLYWILTTITCLMTECVRAKEKFAADGLVVSLLRLWPWCMMTSPLRIVVVELLLTFTNESPSACSMMSNCVGGRTLAGELCGLVGREAALLSRPRPAPLLVSSLHTLRHCVSNQHCRVILLKSDVLNCINKIRVAERTRLCKSSVSAWSQLAEALARYPDGAASLLELRSVLIAPITRTQVMPAIAHAAHYQRNVFLQSHELLEFLSGTLLAGDMSEVVSASRAIWALAANNHRAKLALRSAGASAAVNSTMERLQRSKRDSAADRALQLLTYVNSVLQGS